LCTNDAFGSEGWSGASIASERRWLREDRTVAGASPSPTSAEAFGGFGIDVAGAMGEPIVRVRGNVDLLTAPMLGGVLDGLAQRSCARVTLDLAALELIDASGLRVVARHAARFRSAGATLAVRSAPRDARRLLEITGVDALVEIEDHAALGSEGQPHESQPAPVGAPSLAADLRRDGAIPASNEVIDAALRLVAALASMTVGGADGVSVSLERHGRLTTVASSDDTVLRMDRHQYETGEGPCLDAAHEGRWFHSRSLIDETRWPSFVPLARGEGIASILSTPLSTAARTLGALNMYSNTERAFGPAEEELAALFARQASMILVDAGADVSDTDLAKRIADALHARETIAHAQGVLIERHRVTVDEASSILRRTAREADVTVRLLASDVVASVVAARVDGDTDEDADA
jgi:anti-anti-sigma factor